jgi:predicted phosphodiesterase
LRPVHYGFGHVAQNAATLRSGRWLIVLVCSCDAPVEGLRRIAPVTAIRGNIDTGEWAKNYPDTQIVRLGGRSFYVLHDLRELQFDPARARI